MKYKIADIMSMYPRKEPIGVIDGDAGGAYKGYFMVYMYADGDMLIADTTTMNIDVRAFTWRVREDNKVCIVDEYRSTLMNERWNKEALKFITDNILVGENNIE